MQASSLTPAYRSTSAILTAHGSAAPTRIPMGCCASTCPKAPTSACTAPRRLQPWQPPSTPVPERRLHGKHLPRHLISCFGRPTNIMLRRPLESADNLRPHKTPEVQAVLDGSGFPYRYLPSYSPDLSPIEPGWAKVKSYLRRVAARTVEALGQALAPALDSITAQDAAAFFRHCGYACPN